MAPPKDPDASLAANPEYTSSQISPTTTGPIVSQKLPPPESKESLWLRRSAILSFWAVALLLGLPVWLKTTAIYRADLPLQEMTNWAERKVETLNLICMACTNKATGLQASLPPPHRCRSSLPFFGCATSASHNATCPRRPQRLSSAPLAPHAGRLEGSKRVPAGH